MKEIEIQFVDFDSPEFNDGLDIRYEQLYKAENLPKSVTSDDLDKTSIHCVAKLGNQVIGYGRLSIIDGEGKISQVAVKKDWQKKGIGKQIVEKIIEKAKLAQIMHLYMSARTHVIGFYEKLGFRTVGEIFASQVTKLPHKKMIMNLSQK